MTADILFLPKYLGGWKRGCTRVEQSEQRDGWDVPIIEYCTQPSGSGCVFQVAILGDPDSGYFVEVSDLGHETLEDIHTETLNDAFDAMLEFMATYAPDEELDEFVSSAGTPPVMQR